jgi:mutator family transposase
VLGDICPSAAETFWTEFLRKLARRRPRGIKLVISVANEGIKAAVAKVLHAQQRRRVQDAITRLIGALLLDRVGPSRRSRRSPLLHHPPEHDPAEVDEANEVL